MQNKVKYSKDTKNVISYSIVWDCTTTVNFTTLQLINSITRIHRDTIGEYVYKAVSHVGQVITFQRFYIVTKTGGIVECIRENSKVSFTGDSEDWTITNVDYVSNTVTLKKRDMVRIFSIVSLIEYCNANITVIF